MEAKYLETILVAARQLGVLWGFYHQYYIFLMAISQVLVILPVSILYWSSL